jgi:hypothetical protein
VDFVVLPAILPANAILPTVKQQGVCHPPRGLLASSQRTSHIRCPHGGHTSFRAGSQETRRRLRAHFTFARPPWLMTVRSLDHRDARIRAHSASVMACAIQRSPAAPYAQKPVPLLSTVILPTSRMAVSPAVLRTPLLHRRIVGTGFAPVIPCAGNLRTTSRERAKPLASTTTDTDVHVAD